MSEGTVGGTGTAPGSAPNGAPAPTPTPTPPPTPTASGAASPADAQAQGDPNATVQGQEGDDLQSQVAHWKAMARKNEERAKANADKAGQFDAYQESQKTELQKAQDRAERAEKAAEEAQVERLRLTAASSFQLPADLVSFLGGGTADEINARAESLARVINERAEALSNSRNGNGQPQRQPGGRPVEFMRPGAAPADGSTTPANPDQMFRTLMGRNR